MQIELLETFLDLMETSSFNRTAERLGVTQSTVSSRVQALETALGSRLFERSRAGTRPTAAGQRFLDHARTLRHEYNLARRAVRSAGRFAESMRIGIQHDLAATHIGDWISQFRKVLPQTAFYVELDYSNQMCSDLLTGDLDLGVLFTPRNLPDLHHESLGEIAYRMISTDATRLADVTPERYILANYSPAFDKTHRQMLWNLSSAPLASGQNAAVCRLLETAGGSAYVQEESARAMVETGTYRYVGDAPSIPQSVYLSMHVRHRHSHAHRKLLAIVRRYFVMPA
ncbi:MAG: LysR family transcriptional regulator [Oricola sp.]